MEIKEGNIDNYILWSCALEYVKEGKIFICNTVKVQGDAVIKYEYNVL